LGGGGIKQNIKAYRVTLFHINKIDLFVNKKDKAMEWYLNVLSRNNWAQEKY